MSTRTVLLPLVLGVVVLAAGLTTWLALGRPGLGPTLEMPEDPVATERTWQSTRSWLPEAHPPEAWDPEVVEALNRLAREHSAPVDADLETVVDWIESDGLPSQGCALLALDSKTREVPAKTLRAAGEALIRADLRLEAADLADQMKRGGIERLASASDLLWRVSRKLDVDDKSVRTEDVFRAMAWEASCLDAAFDDPLFRTAIVSEPIVPPDAMARPGWFSPHDPVDIYRTLARDWYGYLLHELHAHRDDPDAMQRLLNEMHAEPWQYGTLAGALDGPAREAEIVVGGLER